MEKDVISVVLPIYNVELYLERSLKSIINQSYKNLEIILVDDGSTDSSGAICDRYKLLDSRISVIHKVNGGLSDARNAGLEYSHGNYIAFVDSDDFVHEDYIRNLYAALHENSADIAICNYIKGGKNSFPKKIYINNKDVSVYTSNIMLKQWHGRYKHIETMAWNKLYKKALFMENNIRYPYGFFNEDVQTTHLLVEKAKKIAIIKDQLYYYFQRSDSITGTWSRKKIQDNIKSQKIRLKFFRDQQLKDAFDRLFIKYLKYHLLAYFHADKKMKVFLVNSFLKNYRKMLKYTSIGTKEKLLFDIFKCFFYVNRAYLKR